MDRDQQLPLMPVGCEEFTEEFTIDAVMTTPFERQANILARCTRSLDTTVLRAQGRAP